MAKVPSKCLPGDAAAPPGAQAVTCMCPAPPHGPHPASQHGHRRHGKHCHVK